MIPTERFFTSDEFISADYFQRDVILILRELEFLYKTIDHYASLSREEALDIIIDRYTVYDRIYSNSKIL